VPDTESEKGEIMRKLFLAWAVTMLLAGSAGAADVHYVLQTPGVT
jgi:hypothetical protein